VPLSPVENAIRDIGARLCEKNFRMMDCVRSAQICALEKLSADEFAKVAAHFAFDSRFSKLFSPRRDGR